jgi:hypothetical protein
MKTHSAANSATKGFAVIVSLTLSSSFWFRAPISAIYGGELVVAVDGTSVTVPVN